MRHDHQRCCVLRLVVVHSCAAAPLPIDAIMTRVTDDRHLFIVIVLIIDFCKYCCNCSYHKHEHVHHTNLPTIMLILVKQVVIHIRYQWIRSIFFFRND